MRDSYPYAIGPRLGAAYQINSKTVLRAGVGVVYNATSTASGSQSNTSATTAVPANSGQTVGLLKDGIPSSVNPQWPVFTSGVGQGVGSVITMPTMLDPNAGRPARLLQWSIGLQREVNRNLVVEASYVGNRGVWWTASTLAPLNAISQETLARYGFTNCTSTEESAMLTSTISGLTPARRSVLASRGVVLPYSNFPTSQTDSAVAPRLPPICTGCRQHDGALFGRIASGDYHGAIRSSLISPSAFPMA